MQQEISKEAKNNNKYAYGLGEGLTRSFIYLDKDIKKQILKTAIAIEPCLVQQQQENKEAQFSDNNLYYSKYADFPIVDTHNKSWLWALQDEEISFSGKRHNFCICFIDMMDSTKISAELNDAGISKYYAIFLNTMATIAKNPFKRTVND